MGARLASQVADRWSHLPERPYRTLMVMALSALDMSRDGKLAAIYWGGHERIARAWRLPWPSGADLESRRRRETILRDVRRVCRSLAEDGAIEIVSTGHPVRDGHAQTYRLTL